jgi:hypothetical protein
MHGPKLEDLEKSVPLANPDLPEEDRPWTVKLKRHAD